MKELKEVLSSHSLQIFSSTTTPLSSQIHSQDIFHIPCAYTWVLKSLMGKSVKRPQIKLLGMKYIGRPFLKNKLSIYHAQNKNKIT